MGASWVGFLARSLDRGGWQREPQLARTWDRGWIRTANDGQAWGLHFGKASLGASMNEERFLRTRQVAWATSERKEPDALGYLPTIDANLFRPLHEATLKEFERGSGGELSGRGDRPAKMRALHSSAALACNVFDYWRGRDSRALTEALDCPALIRDIGFETQLPTGLEGTPPNLDLLLTLDSGERVGVESKFTELYSGQASTPPFKAKYFPAGNGLWRIRGLPHCQDMAEGMRRGALEFSVLNAAQLLKHALGLATGFGDRARLLYLYFDSDGPKGSAHRAEVERFKDLLAGELAFIGISYQDVFARLRPRLGPADTAYGEYLQNRYFSPSPIGPPS